MKFWKILKSTTNIQGRVFEFVEILANFGKEVCDAFSEHCDIKYHEEQKEAVRKLKRDGNVIYLPAKGE